MKNQKLQVIIWALITGCMILGGVLGVYVIGKETGEYYYGMAIAIAAGTVISFIIHLLFSKWKKKRNGNVPDVDERTVILMKRYLMAVLYIVLFGTGAVLLILYSMGVHYIETGMAIVYVMTLFMLIGIGALIIKRL